MDKLEVLKKAEENGNKEPKTEDLEKTFPDIPRGTIRRKQIEKLIIYARNLGCQVLAGGGAVGGINFRYGSIGYAIMDINTEGEVKLYAQPHPNKEATQELKEKINKFLEEYNRKDDKDENGSGDDEGKKKAKKLPDLHMKSHPINCHGLLSQKVEEVNLNSLIKFLEIALQGIKDTYYKL